MAGEVQGGGVHPFVVGYLWAGSNKGETWLPPGRLVEHPFTFQTSYFDDQKSLQNHFYFLFFFYVLTSQHRLNPAKFTYLKTHRQTSSIHETIRNDHISDGKLPKVKTNVQISSYLHFCHPKFCLRPFPSACPTSD